MHFYCNDLQKWIGNERQKRRQSGENEQQSKRIKLPPMQRGPNAYNIFCAEIFRTGKVKNATDWLTLNNCESPSFKIHESICYFESICYSLNNMYTGLIHLSLVLSFGFHCNLSNFGLNKKVYDLL